MKGKYRLNMCFYTSTVLCVRLVGFSSFFKQLCPCFRHIFVCFCHRRMSGITTNDGKWHHICASWDNSDGSWQFYKNGTLAESGAGLREGYTIMGGGLLVIGQEQDALGGGFDATQSFQGHLTGVNVWSSVLPSETIKEMSKSCLRGKGKVYKWSDFRYTVRGSPEVVIPSPCVPLQE